MARCCRSHCLVQVCSRAIGSMGKKGGMIAESGVPVALCAHAGTGIALTPCYLLPPVHAMGLFLGPSLF